MKTRYKKVVWTVSVVAVLICGYVVLESVAHPQIGQRLSPSTVDGLESGIPVGAGRPFLKEPIPIQELEQKERHTQMVLRIKAARESRDMRELAKIGDEIEATWSSLDASYYASLMLEVSNSLSSTDLKDDEQYVLEQKYASLVLSKQLEIPIDVEVNLVLHLQEDIEYVKGQVNADEWPERRRKKAEIWLRTWQRLNAEIDPQL